MTHLTSSDRLCSEYSGNLLLGTTAATVIVLAFFAFCEDSRHWFLLPLLLCGTMIGGDVIAWARGKVDLFDPLGILGIFAWKTYFWAPLLHVALDEWGRTYPFPPDDWRPWLGWMAVLNFLGYAVYRVSAAYFSVSGRMENKATVWQVNPSRVFVVIFYAAIASVITQMVVYAKFGGLAGYIAAFEQRSEAFRGMAIVFAVSEACPILLFMGFIFLVRMRRSPPQWGVLSVALAVYFFLIFFFGGLRGSRSEILQSMFWAIGMIHSAARPVSRKFIIACIVAGVAFLYIYGFYKKHGREGFLAAIASHEERRQLENQGMGEGPWYSRALGLTTPEYTLYEIFGPGRGFPYALGRTYLGAVARIIPLSVWPDRPEGLQLEAAMLFYGSAEKNTSLVWGLNGEALLNFGPLGVPLVFLLPGFVVGRLRRASAAWPRHDVRWLIFPFFVLICVTMLGADSTSLPYFVVKNGFMPVAVLYLGASRRIVTRKNIALRREARFMPRADPRHIPQSRAA